MLINFFSSIIPKRLASDVKSPLNEPLSVLHHLDTKQMHADLKALHHCALQDDATAIFKLGLRYYKGLGVGQDHNLAYGIFMLLWNEDADAEFYMGEICRHAFVDSKPDYDQACRHYAAAFIMGNMQAKLRLKEVAEMSRDDFWLGWRKHNDTE